MVISVLVKIGLTAYIRVPSRLFCSGRTWYVENLPLRTVNFNKLLLAMSNITSLQSQASDNTLINGRMPYNCSSAVNGTSCSSNASYSKYRVKAGKTYRLRLINSGAGGIQYFSIDDHSLTVISNDFVYVEPYNTNFVTLGVRSRISSLLSEKDLMLTASHRSARDRMFFSHRKVDLTTRTGCVHSNRVFSAQELGSPRVEL